MITVEVKENIHDCWAFDEPAYCVGGGPGCEGCPWYVPKVKTPIKEDDSPFVDEDDLSD